MTADELEDYCSCPITQARQIPFLTLLIKLTALLLAFACFISVRKADTLVILKESRCIVTSATNS